MHRALFCLCLMSSHCILFVLSFSFCRGDAGHSSLRSMATFVTFPSLSVVGIFLHLLRLLLPFSDFSSHNLNPPNLAVVFLVFCTFPVSLSQIFSVISRLYYNSYKLCLLSRNSASCHQHYRTDSFPVASSDCLPHHQFEHGKDLPKNHNFSKQLINTDVFISFWAPKTEIS